MESPVHDETKNLVAPRKSSHDLVGKLPAAIYTCDKEGFITYYNDAAAALWGRTPELGKDKWCGSWKIFMTDGSAMSPDLCPMATVLKEGRTVIPSEIIVQTPDGIRRNILPHPVPLYDENGEMTGALNMLVDITAQKKFENQVRESEQRFRMLANAAPVLIWMADATGKISFLNQKWEDYTGIAIASEKEEWTKNIHPDDQPKVKGLYYQAFETQKEFIAEYRFRWRDNSYRWLYSYGIPKFDSDGNFAGYIGSCQDITVSRQHGEVLEKLIAEATSQLKWKNEELQRSNAELSSFSYIASHDLQEPLRKIITFADRLELTYKKDLPAGATDYLDRIMEAARRMSRLIEDLLEFSRVRSDENLQSTDLNEIVRNVIADFDQRISEKKATIHLEALPSIPAIPLRMTQLFHNLISNALKFAKEEQAPVITISAANLSEAEKKKNPRLSPEKKYTHIIVRDNGIGFNQQFAERIFTIFQRLHGKSEYTGTGIGLALCRKITDYHKGLIYATGEEKKGSEFHIILPL